MDRLEVKPFVTKAVFLRNVQNMNRSMAGFEDLYLDWYSDKLALVNVKPENRLYRNQGELMVASLVCTASVGTITNPRLVIELDEEMATIALCMWLDGEGASSVPNYAVFEASELWALDEILSVTNNIGNTIFYFERPSALRDDCFVHAEVELSPAVTKELKRRIEFAAIELEKARVTKALEKL